MADEPESITTKHRYITEVTYFPPPDDYQPEGENLMRAEVNVVFDEDYVCKGFHIFQSDEGLWVSMPASEDQSGEYHDRLFPITEAGREHLHAVILRNFPKSSVAQLSPENIKAQAQQSSESTGGSGGGWSASAAGGGGWGDTDNTDQSDNAGGEDSGWGEGSGSGAEESGETTSQDSSGGSWGSDNTEAQSGEESSSNWGEAEPESSGSGWGADADKQSPPSDQEQTPASGQKQPSTSQGKTTPQDNQSTANPPDSTSLLVELIDQAGLQLAGIFVGLIFLVSIASAGTVYLLLSGSTHNSNTPDKQVAMEKSPESQQVNSSASTTESTMDNETSSSGQSSFSEQSSSSGQSQTGSSADEQVISWRQAGNYTGQKKNVRGEIVGTFETSNIKILNFSEGPGDFTTVIKSANFDKFPSDLKDHFVGETVKVTGEIATYDGDPQIVLSSPDQIEIVN